MSISAEENKKVDEEASIKAEEVRIAEEARIKAEEEKKLAQDAADKADEARKAAERLILQERENLVKAQREAFELKMKLKEEQQKNKSKPSDQSVKENTILGSNQVCDNHTISADGRTKTYFINGDPVFEEKYYDVMRKKQRSGAHLNSSGIYHGSVRKFDADGKISDIETYVNGQKHGPQISYNRSSNSDNVEEKVTNWIDGVEQTRTERFKKFGTKFGIKFGKYACFAAGGAILGGLLPGVSAVAGLVAAPLIYAAKDTGLAERAWDRFAPDILLTKDRKQRRIERLEDRSGVQSSRNKLKDLKGAKKSSQSSGSIFSIKNLAIATLGFLVIGNGIKSYNDRPNKDHKFKIKEMFKQTEDIGGKPAFVITVGDDDRQMNYQIADDGTSMENESNVYLVELDGDEWSMENLQTHLNNNRYANKGNSFESKGDNVINYIGNTFKDAAKGFEIAMKGSDWYDDVATERSFTADNNQVSEDEKDRTLEYMRTLEENLGEQFVMRKVELSDTQNPTVSKYTP